MKKTEEKIFGTFRKYAHFGFFIPEKRDFYGGDFFVNNKNDLGALDGQRVTARELAKAKGKKPEAKIISLLGKKTIKDQEHKNKTCVGIYIQTTPEFGFIEIPGAEKGFFVHNSKKGGAKSGDRVKAELAEYNGKKEGIIKEILSTNDDIIEGELKDNGDFGFVFTKKGDDDIFVSAVNYNGAKGGDKVQVQVTKTGGRRPEGIILKQKKETD